MNTLSPRPLHSVGRHANADSAQCPTDQPRSSLSRRLGTETDQSGRIMVDTGFVHT